jgi:predicted HTH domain antitoxin
MRGGAYPYRRNFVGMARKITLELPDQLDMDEKELLLMLAAHLYGDGKLSLGQAAGMAGMGKPEFIHSLGRFGVSLFNAPVDDYLKDIRNA